MFERRKKKNQNFQHDFFKDVWLNQTNNLNGKKKVFNIPTQT